MPFFCLKEESAVTLEQFFFRHPKAALAFSGGVDSAYLLWAGPVSYTHLTLPTIVGV